MRVRLWCARASPDLARADLASGAPRLRPLVARAARTRSPPHSHDQWGRAAARPPAATITTVAAVAAVVAAVVAAGVAAAIATAIATATDANATAPARAQTRALPTRVRQVVVHASVGLALGLAA